MRALYEYLRVTMPPGKPNALRASDYLNVIALILSVNAHPAGDREFPNDVDLLVACS